MPTKLFMAHVHDGTSATAARSIWKQNFVRPTPRVSAVLAAALIAFVLVPSPALAKSYG